MLEIMNILPVQINDTHNDSCGGTRTVPSPPGVGHAGGSIFAHLLERSLLPHLLLLPNQHTCLKPIIIILKDAVVGAVAGNP